ncbi:hypothetical protein VTO73DRAFT_5346 [Trametes versicolor]
MPRPWTPCSAHGPRECASGRNFVSALRKLVAVPRGGSRRCRGFLRLPYRAPLDPSEDVSTPRELAG